MVTFHIGWVAVAFFVGALVGVFGACLMAARAEDAWRVAYLNTRDRLWKLEREQEGA